MPDTKISALTALTGATIATNDDLAIVDTSATETKRISVQELITGTLGSTSITGATVTTSQPLLNLTQTWNAGGVTFTGLRFNATDTASASASLLLDLQVGGSSKFAVNKAGRIFSELIGNDSAFGATNAAIFFTGANEVHYVSSGEVLRLTSTALQIASTINLNWNSDLILGRNAAASLRLGAADAAAPVAQTLGVQSVVAGTSNTAGTNFTIRGSAGTGTGAGGSIIFQVAPAGSSGTAQNAFSTALTIGSNQTVALARTSGSDAIVDLQFGGSANTGWFSTGGSANLIATFSGTRMIDIRSAGVSFSNGTILLGPVAGAQSILVSEAANTLALRNGTSAQTFNVYNTYTDASNYERGIVTWGDVSNEFTVGTTSAGTGSSRRLGLRGQLGVYIRVGGSPGTAVWEFNSSGHFAAVSDNSYDIGLSGANRPRNVYVGTSITPGAGVAVASLPTPSTGMIARVTNASAPAVGSTVVGGGAAQALVWYNGANWTVIGV